MITKEMVERINFLSKKSKSDGLTDEEKSEQQVLRRQYIDFIKKQVKDQLDCIEIVDEKDKGCSCGHDHGHDHDCGHGHVHSHSCSCKKH